MNRLQAVFALLLCFVSTVQVSSCIISRSSEREKLSRGICASQAKTGPDAGNIIAGFLIGIIAFTATCACLGW